MNSNSLKFINGTIVGAISTVVFIVALTIAGDLYAPLKNFLKEAHHHHWVGKGIWAAILFVIVTPGYYFVKKNDTSDNTTRLMRILAWISLLGALTLLLFFVYEFFKH